MQNISDVFPAILNPASSHLDPENVGYFFAKGSLLLLAGMYLVFAIITVRQVKIMNTTIETPLGPLIQVIAWLNLVVSIFLLIGILAVL